MTIKEVYSGVIAAAQEWDDQATKTTTETLRELYSNKAAAYWMCAKWLEEIEEINPTKKEYN